MKTKWKIKIDCAGKSYTVIAQDRETAIMMLGTLIDQSRMTVSTYLEPVDKDTPNHILQS